MKIFNFFSKTSKDERDRDEILKDEIVKNKKIATWYHSEENFRIENITFHYFLRGNTGLIEGSTFSRLLAKGIPKWEVSTLILKKKTLNSKELEKLMKTVEDFRLRESFKWLWLVLILDEVSGDLIKFVKENRKWEIGLVLLDLKNNKFYRNKNMISKPLKVISKK